MKKSNVMSAAAMGRAYLCALLPNSVILQVADGIKYTRNIQRRNKGNLVIL